MHFTALLTLSSTTWYLLSFTFFSPSGSDLVLLVNHFFNQLLFDSGIAL